MIQSRTAFCFIAHLMYFVKVQWYSRRGLDWKTFMVWSLIASSKPRADVLRLGAILEKGGIQANVIVCVTPAHSISKHQVKGLSHKSSNVGQYLPKFIQDGGHIIYA